MASKRKNSSDKSSDSKHNAKEKQANLREPAGEDDCFIKVFDCDGQRHRLNWTRLLQLAPETCFYRLFALGGEQIRRHQWAACPGWFMRALCTYVDSLDLDAVFTVPGEYEAAATVKILNNLCWQREKRDIALHPALSSMLAGIITGPYSPAERQLDDLKRTAANLSLRLLEKSSALPLRVEVIDGKTTCLALSTDDNGGPVWDSLVRRLYRTLKLMGPAAFDPDGDCTYRFKAPLFDSDNTRVTVEGEVKNVKTSPEYARFRVSYDLLIRHHESDKIENPFD